MASKHSGRLLSTIFKKTRTLIYFFSSILPRTVNLQQPSFPPILETSATNSKRILPKRNNIRSVLFKPGNNFYGASQVYARKTTKTGNAIRSTIYTTTREKVVDKDEGNLLMLSAVKQKTRGKAEGERENTTKREKFFFGIRLFA